MDFKTLKNSFIEQIQDYFKTTGRSKAIIGISGGKDSTICAKLLVEALGVDNVYAVSLPLTYELDPNIEEETPMLDEDTKKVVDEIGLKNVIILPIMDPAQSFYNVIKDAGLNPSEQAEINNLPRIRMTMLYYYAQTIGDALVINTSNLSEKLVGYFTIWGDGTGDFAILKDLFVSEVIGLGRELELSKELIEKTPDDGISGMSDEEKLGFKYSDVEECIHGIMKDGGISNWKKAVQSFHNIALSGQYKCFKDLTEGQSKVYEAHKKNAFKQDLVKIPGCEKLIC